MKATKEKDYRMSPVILKVIEIYVKFVFGLCVVIVTCKSLLVVFKNPLVCIVGIILFRIVHREFKKQSATVGK